MFSSQKNVSTRGKKNYFCCSVCVRFLSFSRCVLSPIFGSFESCKHVFFFVCPFRGTAHKYFGINDGKTLRQLTANSPNERMRMSSKREFSFGSSVLKTRHSSTLSFFFVSFCPLNVWHSLVAMSFVLTRNSDDFLGCSSLRCKNQHTVHDGKVSVCHLIIERQRQFSFSFFFFLFFFACSLPLSTHSRVSSV